MDIMNEIMETRHDKIVFFFLKKESKANKSKSTSLSISAVCVCASASLQLTERCRV